MFSCVDPSNDNTNEIDEKNNAKLYSAMIGTWVNEKDDSDKINFTEETLRKGVSIEELLNHASKEPITDEDYENNTTNYENLKWLLEICNEKSICFYETSSSTPEFIITYAVYKLNIDNTTLTGVSGWAVDGPVPPKTYIRPNKENTDTKIMKIHYLSLIFPVHIQSARQTALHLLLHLMATGHTNTIQEPQMELGQFLKEKLQSTTPSSDIQVQQYLQ